jgi:hypothetical protein
MEGKNKKALIIKQEEIRSKILTIRGVQVILDRDLAELYGVETGRLNRAVNRNKERFPKDFMFKLKKREYENLKCQFGISSLEHGGRRALPYAFTEQGVANLSSVLRSKKAIEVNVKIIRAFVAMRRFFEENNEVLNRMDNLGKKQIGFEIKTDERFEKVFDYLKTEKPKQGIFFEGEIFDAYEFVSDLVKNAKKEILLIDNYIDESVLTLFKKRRKGVKVTIYTRKITKELKLDLEKFNSQYEKIEIKEISKFHDRFLIIDQQNIFHFGASLKNLGEKCFAFSKFEKETFEALKIILNSPLH